MTAPQSIGTNVEAAVEILGQYVDASASSASRARTILIVMITASVLTLVAFWNTRPDAWLTQRLNKANAALMLFDRVKKDRLPEEEAKKRFADEKRYNEARNYIDARNINDRDLLMDYIERLRALQIEQVTTLHVPFFGVAFDVNDLGIFAGLTFSVILLWFRFSLVRELANLRETFSEAKALGDEYTNHCYNLLAMRQVLTTPPPLHALNSLSNLKHSSGMSSVSNISGRGIWRILPEFLLFLPLLVSTIVFGHDLRTINLALTVDWFDSLMLVALSLIFLIFILTLTIVCWRLSRSVDEEWKKQASDLYDQRMPPQTGISSRLSGATKEKKKS